MALVREFRFPASCLGTPRPGKGVKTLPGSKSQKRVSGEVFEGPGRPPKRSQKQVLPGRGGSQLLSRAAKRGCFKRGVSRSGLVLPFLSFFGTFPIFLQFSRFARGRSGDFPDCPFPLSQPLLRAPTRNSPERVRDTIWTFPEKSGKHPGLETPRHSFSHSCLFLQAIAGDF